ncbi:MAG: SAM-dependent methyltransferase [Deltaproteobacteria bacterium]|nr:SAM-dependent methyltransferase [Deltaproteobacteria bacterium]
MSISYESIVPWGRSYSEYGQMFALEPHDLNKKILGCGDGPAAFNSECLAHNGHCISVDPVYRYSTHALRQRIDETFDAVMAQTRANRDKFLWTHIPSVEALGAQRMAAMMRFLDDFAKGKREGRYIPGALPALPFVNDAFDLALSSHFLFLYSDMLSKEFHIDAIFEMVRVAAEVRIFPVVNLNAQTSPYLEPVINHFKNGGYAIELQKVNYEFQKGGHTMLSIRRALATDSP